MGLFGGESKQVEQALLKVQSAMALQQGISGVFGAIDSFKLLGAQASAAFAKIRAGISSTGIGALVIALALIVAYWDDIVGAVSGVSAEQTKLNEKAQKQLDIEKKKQESISDQDNVLKLQGKSERDILKIKIAQTDQTIKAAEIQIENQIATNKAQAETAKRNKDILQGLIRLVTLPITAILSGIDLIGKSFGQNFNLEGQFSGGLAKLVFDPEATAKKGSDTLAEQQKYLNKLKNDRAGFQLQINQVDSEASKKSIEEQKQAQKTKDENDKIAEQKKKEFDDKVAEEKRNTDKIKRDAEIAAIKDDLKRKEAVIDEAALIETNKNKKLLEDKLITQEDYNLREAAAKATNDAAKLALEEEARNKAAELELTNRKALNDAKLLEAQRVNEILGSDNPEEAALKIANLAKAKLDAENVAFEIEKENKALSKGQLELLEQQHVDKITAINKEASEAKIKIETDEKKAKEALINSYQEAASGVASLLGEQTVAAKAIGVANALINTYQAISAANKLPYPANIPAIISAAATGFAAVRNIVQTKVPGKSSGGSMPAGANVPAPLAPQAQTTTLDQASINGIGQASSRAFVLETDVTNNQERIARLNRAARIN
jgi:hypothetical protein